MSNKVQTYPFLRLLRYARRYHGRIFLAALYSIFNKLFDLVPPLLIGLAVDVLVEQDTSFVANWGYTDTMTQLWILAGLALLTWLLESILGYASIYMWRDLAQSLQHDARMDVYAHVQKLEMAYFEDRSTGGLMSILNNDVNQLERFLDYGLHTFIQIAVAVIAIGAWFIYIAPSVVWVAIVPMPFLIYASLRFQKSLVPRYRDVRDRVGVLNGQLNNNLRGIATIKSFTAESHEIERIHQQSEAYLKANRQAITLSSAFAPVIRIIIAFGFVFVLVFGGSLVIQGSLAIGLYSTTVFLTQRLLWPLKRLGETLDRYQRAMASATRLLDLLDTEVKIVGGSAVLPEIAGEVVFDNVSFGYTPDKPVLQNFSLRIPAGRTIAMVGATGSGKSTIIKLLLRFYDVNEGRILVDGHDIRTLDLANLRQAVGLVSQDVFLFQGSVRENIVYGSFDAHEDALVDAARASEAHDFILQLTDGYDTTVGERGQKLSGGQRQRLSIARAVIKNPPILILDEATSSVDNETEAAIQRSLEKIAVGRTTIIIAHRLSTIRNADIIYVLDRGHIAEEGDHQTLLARNGVYADLWRIQTGETTLSKQAMPY